MEETFDFEGHLRQGSTMRMEILVVVAWALTACKTPEPAATGTAGEAETPARCAIELTVEREKSGGFWFLHANAKNTTDALLRLKLHDRCPGGVADFRGLGEGYDYYGTCAMGACAEREAPELELPPGALVRVATAVVAPRGNGCQPALTPGTYELSFGLPLSSPMDGVCSQTLRLEHQLE